MIDKQNFASERPWGKTYLITSRQYNNFIADTNSALRFLKKFINVWVSNQDTVFSFFDALWVRWLPLSERVLNSVDYCSRIRALVWCRLICTEMHTKYADVKSRYNLREYLVETVHTSHGWGRKKLMKIQYSQFIIMMLLISCACHGDHSYTSIAYGYFL